MPHLYRFKEKLTKMDFKIFLPRFILLRHFSLLPMFLISSQTARLISAEEFRESGANLQSVSEVTIPPDFSALNQLQNLYLIGNGIVTIGK